MRGKGAVRGNGLGDRQRTHNSADQEPTGQALEWVICAPSRRAIRPTLTRSYSAFGAFHS